MTQESDIIFLMAVKCARKISGHELISEKF